MTIKLASRWVLLEQSFCLPLGARAGQPGGIGVAVLKCSKQSASVELSLRAQHRRKGPALTSRGWAGEAYTQ